MLALKNNTIPKSPLSSTCFYSKKHTHLRCSSKRQHYTPSRCCWSPCGLEGIKGAAAHSAPARSEVVGAPGQPQLWTSGISLGTRCPPIDGWGVLMQTSRPQPDRQPNCTESGLLLRDGGQCWLQPPSMLLGASLQCYDGMGLILDVTTPPDLTTKPREVDAPMALAQVTRYSRQTSILCMSTSSHSFSSCFPHTQGNQSTFELQGALPNLDGFTRLHKLSNCSPGFYTSVKSLSCSLLCFPHLTSISEAHAQNYSLLLITSRLKQSTIMQIQVIFGPKETSHTGSVP